MLTTEADQGLFGPEGAAVVGDAMYVGTRDGKLMRLRIKSTAPMLLGNPESVCGVVGGRILGLHSAGGDDLILAEAVKGTTSCHGGCVRVTSLTLGDG